MRVIQNTYNVHIFCVQDVLSISNAIFIHSPESRLSILYTITIIQRAGN